MKNNFWKVLSVAAVLAGFAAGAAFAKEPLKIGIADDAVNGARALKRLKKPD